MGVYIESAHLEFSQMLAGFTTMALPCPSHLTGGQARDATDRNLFSATFCTHMIKILMYSIKLDSELELSCKSLVNNNFKYRYICILGKQVVLILLTVCLQALTFGIC